MYFSDFNKFQLNLLHARNFQMFLAQIFTINLGFHLPHKLISTRLS